MMQMLKRAGTTATLLLVLLPTGAVANPVLTVRGHTGPIRAVAFSPDDTRIFSVGGVGFRDAFKASEVKGGKEVFSAALTAERDAIGAAAIAPNGKVVAMYIAHLTFDPPKHQLWHKTLSTQELSYGSDIDRLNGPVLAMAFAPDSNMFAVVMQDQVLIFDGVTRQRLNTTACKATCAVYAPDNKTLATGDGKGEITLWKASTMKPRGTFLAHKVVQKPKGEKPDDKMQLVHVGVPLTALAIDAKSETLASAGRDNLVKIWNLADNKFKTGLQGHDEPVRSIAFSPDGKYVATGSEDHTIKLWDAATFKEVATLDAHLGPVTCLAWSGDSKLLASGADDRLIKLWDVAKAVAGK
jgi:WD40 repeat protein